MKKFYLFLTLIGLVGCSVVPKYTQCQLPKFTINDSLSVKKHFFTEDLFFTYCPAETPEVFNYLLDNNVLLSISVANEWMYLKASSDHGVVTLYADGLRVVKFNAFTHALPLSALKNNTLSLLINNTVSVDLPFSWVSCTCVLYDAY
jgi:hypothetical protein